MQLAYRRVRASLTAVTNPVQPVRLTWSVLDTCLALLHVRLDVNGIAPLDNAHWYQLVL